MSELSQFIGLNNYDLKFKFIDQNGSKEVFVLGNPWILEDKSTITFFLTDKKEEIKDERKA